MNDVFYQLTAFMTLHEAVFWRWSHVRHHTDTLVVGRDREISVQRPPKLWVAIVDFFDLHFAPIEIARLFKVAAGNLNAETRDIVPESEWKRLIRSSRIYALIFMGLAVWCIAIGSILPAMFIVLPRLYGAALSQLFNVTQHTGLAENVLDHRQNCRTVYMNPVFRFLYVNMNYHVEHHMFPMVPYHALPKLHALIKDQCAPAYPSVWEAYKEIIPAVFRQRKDPEYFVKRSIPDGRREEIAQSEPLNNAEPALS
jgi:fatty acid desaturase